MKFDFNPKIEATELEKKILIDFSRTIEDACNNTTCDTCALFRVCEQENVPHFLNGLYDTLGIL